MSSSKWPYLVVAGVLAVWGGGKAIDWFNSSYAEASASNRITNLFVNLRANADSTVAVAMWTTGSMETGSQRMDQATWNTQFTRMMSWVEAGSLRYPIGRFEVVRPGR